MSELFLEDGKAISRAILQTERGLLRRTRRGRIQALAIEQIAGRIAAGKGNHAGLRQILEQLADRRTGRRFECGIEREHGDGPVILSMLVDGSSASIVAIVRVSGKRYLRTTYCVFRITSSAG
jgi:hypothetical protein